MVVGDEILAVPSRLDRVKAILVQIAERQDRMQATLDALADDLAAFAREVRQLVERFDRIEGRWSNVEGGLLESRYHHNLKNWLGAYLWPVEQVGVDELDLLPHAVDSGEVRPGDVERMRDLDLLVRGQDKSHPAAGVLVLAVELSQTINVDDVERADERAETLRRAGYHARGFTGGYRVHPDASQAAAKRDVVIDLRRSPT